MEETKIKHKPGRKRGKVYTEEEIREHKRIYHQKYYQEHKEKMNAQALKWHDDHREEINANKRKWNATFGKRVLNKEAKLLELKNKANGRKAV